MESIIIVLTGESGVGKTTLCERVVALARSRGMDIAGVLTPPRLQKGEKVGIDVQDLRTGERRPFAERSPFGKGPSTETWHFHPEGLEWGVEVLRDATPCDLFVVDELGPLELGRGEGWTIALDLLRAGEYKCALVVVRPALLADLLARLEGIHLQVVNGARSNQDQELDRIAALLSAARPAGAADD